MAGDSDTVARWRRGLQVLIDRRPRLAQLYTSRVNSLNIHLITPTDHVRRCVPPHPVFLVSLFISDFVQYICRDIVFKINAGILNLFIKWVDKHIFCIIIWNLSISCKSTVCLNYQEFATNAKCQYHYVEDWNLYTWVIPYLYVTLYLTSTGNNECWTSAGTTFQIIQKHTSIQSETILCPK